MIEVQLPHGRPRLDPKGARALLQILLEAEARKAEANDETPRRDQAS